jgi:hypothetical protein
VDQGYNKLRQCDQREQAGELKGKAWASFLVLLEPPLDCLDLTPLVPPTPHMCSRSGGFRSVPEILLCSKTFSLEYPEMPSVLVPIGPDYLVREKEC